MIDSHTHSSFSHDSFERAESMIERAIELNLSYFALTNHLDNDCRYNYIGFGEVPQLDFKGWAAERLRLKEKYKGKINLACGLEIGFDIPSQNDDKKVIDGYEFDVIINSVHNVSSTDIYYPQFFDGKEKKEIYSKYLLTIYESLRAYDYDIIGHIGYIMRKAPYKNKKLEYSDHSDVLDEILKSIISKNKTIELNTHSEGTGLNFFPTSEILKRYKELGGTNVSFGSDAHSKFDIGRNYKFAAEGAKEYGFDYWTCYTERRENKIKID